MKRLVSILTLGLAACAPNTPPAPVQPGAHGAPEGSRGPFAVVLFIGDGAGVAQWTAGRLTSPSMAIDRFPVIGLVDTRASNSRVTDSAAGATAYATGVRTFNGAIGVGPDSVPVPTVLELAEELGMSTGLVATSTITHATPASFAAHVPSRNQHFDIAADIADREIEVLLGGGRRFFDPATRPDAADLLAVLRRDAAYVETAAAFEALSLDTVRALVGLFAENNPGPAVEREPSLQDLTGAALEVLAPDEDGFFLMVEGSQIDWRSHDNAPINQVIAEVLDFDMAIGRALRFLEHRPNTLVLVVADHETGGLALHGGEDGVFGAHYTTEGHTAEMVPLFAAGPGAHLFGGIKDNHVVGQLLLELVRQGGPAIAPHASIGAGTSWSHSSPSRPH